MVYNRHVYAPQLSGYVTLSGLMHVNNFYICLSSHMLCQRYSNNLCITTERLLKCIVHFLLDI